MGEERGGEVARNRSRPTTGTRGGSRRRVAAAVPLLVTLALTGHACRSGPGREERRAAAAPTSDAEAVLCESARDLLGRLGAAVDPGRPGDVDPAAAVYRELASFLEVVARTGPSELQADAATAATVTREYYEALQGVGFVPGRVPPETSAKLQSQQFATGIGRAADYARTTCGLGG